MIQVALPGLCTTQFRIRWLAFEKSLSAFDIAAVRISPRSSAIAMDPLSNVNLHLTLVLVLQLFVLRPA